MWQTLNKVSKFKINDCNNPDWKESHCIYRQTDLALCAGDKELQSVQAQWEPFWQVINVKAAKGDDEPIH